MADKNALIEVNRRAMEFIWSKCPKEIQNDEEFVVYEETDIPALYYSGLVDTQRYKLKHWEQALEDCRHEDGRYWVNHAKMIFLGMFRYSKRVGEPFDPLKMRTGKYSVDRLWNVFEKSVIPSCALEKVFIKNAFDAIVIRQKSAKDIFGNVAKEAKEKEELDIDLETEEAQKHFSLLTGNDGKAYVEVSREVLEGIKSLLDNYPSPRRKMEIGVQEVRLGKLQKLADQAKESQKSSFEAGKDFRETTKKDLKDMLVKASENPTGGRKPSGEVLDLKNLQRKGRPKKY